MQMRIERKPHNVHGQSHDAKNLSHSFEIIKVPAEFAILSEHEQWLTRGQQPKRVPSSYIAHT